jgi:UDP-N-acetylmuramoyl-L-alanyl-D-glutamate--2,6-diaminopimelate ligase
MDKILSLIKKIIPKNIFKALQPVYHFALAWLGAVIYRFPSRKIKVVAVTGTKGKTSVVEILNAIFEEAGYKTAASSTLRFKLGEQTRRNLYKMTMPGRFFVQKFLRDAVKNGCSYAFVEMTSEGAKQFRHKFVYLDALIFTNLAPEHIESHGSYEKYREAKLKIAKALENSPKKDRVMVANMDDQEGRKFLNVQVPIRLGFTLSEAEPYTLQKDGLEMTFGGKHFKSFLSGTFNIYNILAAASYAKSQHVDSEVIKRALEKFRGIRGRVERIEEGQDFNVIVDYAHTPDSLEKLYEAFQNSPKICVLGNTGGGRDKWKRKVMAEIADRHCEEIILANEDPYDEDPKAIVDEMASAIKETPVEIILDRRAAINTAISRAKTGESVLITGKGTDPYIMGPKGTKLEWDDATVAREELRKILKK